MQVSIDDFFELRKQLPIVDVRSEGEYDAGHIQSAVNIPILNNAERIAVGTDYKQKGQHEAIKTGFKLVGPRLSNIIETTEKVGNEILVHCWRGGMRSGNFCQFVEMAKVKTHALKGGYKAYRQRVVDSFKIPKEFLVIAGSTGSGKSEILRALKKAGEQVVDLEGLAHHKGSVFGGLMMPLQPTTEQFHNNLFEALVLLDADKRIWIEDESIAIGKIFLPEPLWNQMKMSPVVELQVDKQNRINRLVNEYGMSDKNQFLDAMSKITKKLGGQHFNAARGKLLAGDMHATIDILLTYYDKAYNNGLERKKNRIVSRVPWNGIQPEHCVSELQKLSANTVKDK